MSPNEQIPFEVEAGRVIELLARQIYQTPLALLRENCQNAFDAILLRRAKDLTFSPMINVTIESNRIVVEDNGIGMTRDEIRSNYWRAGSSGKNTPEARAAGVVGTFGIGAMANFGIASELEVISESAITTERTRSFAKKSELSTSKNCISIEATESLNTPGTKVIATCATTLNIGEAINYVKSFVAHVPFPVHVNGILVSQQPYENDVPELSGTSKETRNLAISQGLIADLKITINPQADVRVHLSNLRVDNEPVKGEVLLRQGKSVISTFRNGFGLAPCSMTSSFGFGGIVDLPLLVPTAGREALSTATLQFLQVMISSIDAQVSYYLSELPESDNSIGLMNWALQHNKINLCGCLNLRREPGNQGTTLKTLRKDAGGGKVRFYGGSDHSILEANASQETPVYVLATRSPRRNIEQQYLQSFCEAEEISGQPQIINLKSKSDLSLSESGFLFRINNILESDYFVRAELNLGEISHGLPLLVEQEKSKSKITFNPKAGCNSTVIELYDTDYPAFGSMVKDYVRSIVFPKIQHIVPSATRQGAAAFLKSIERPRELFEIEMTDMQSLHEIWAKYAEGAMSFEEAATRSRDVAQASFQVFDSSSARPAREVIGDVIENEKVVGPSNQSENIVGSPFPGIDRTDVNSDAKVLVVDSTDQPIRGFRCFISIVDKVRERNGEFFLQPHRTSIVWGGQRVLFIFQHISGEYGIYYDLQASKILSSESGGGVYETCTIVMKNRIFIPVPEAIQSAFIPTVDERKRFEVSCDLLFTEEV